MIYEFSLAFKFSKYKWHIVCELPSESNILKAFSSKPFGVFMLKHMVHAIDDVSTIYLENGKPMFLEIKIFEKAWDIKDWNDTIFVSHVI